MTAFRRWPIWAAIGAALMVFLLANAHFVYVAFTSDPGCVKHLKQEGTQPGQYRAARSAC